MNSSRESRFFGKGRVPRTAALVQLGCDKNTVDGERILGELDSAGYEIVGLPLELWEKAGETGEETGGSKGWRPVDVLVVNTCSFISPARTESRKAVERAVRLRKRQIVKEIVVAGCFAPLLAHRLPGELRRNVRAFLGPGDLSRVAERIEGKGEQAGQDEPFFRPPARSLDPGPRFLTSSAGTAFVKIADGCDKGCSFCSIPFYRGGFRSRPKEEIAEEIAGLLRLGVREVVLVSQDTAHWGRDRGEDLAELLRFLARKAEREAGIREYRIRLHYLYPSCVTDRLLDVWADCDIFVPYFDIPIQHASPKVLRAMNRPPDPDGIRRIVESIRERFSESAIRTTVITGHPGEGEKEFGELISFLEEIRFDRVGVFPFFKEPGTAAARMRRPRGGFEVARRRADRILEIQGSISAERLRARVGRRYRVLMDTPWTGRSPLEAPDVDGVIQLKRPSVPGRMVDVEIVAALDHDLEGRLVEEKECRKVTQGK
ncbi:MAG: MiaB/RimO family radical SAM methylthiotransferase [Candidatus Hydrogenedentota bacterium]|nr:MAG: MiaB/RimO family radical SAM methylthiotransferase [Candidatus Hydrogenedentota bacterium]